MDKVGQLINAIGINRLRAKLDNISSFKNGGQLVQTVWGVGYKLDVTGHVTSALSA